MIVRVFHKLLTNALLSPKLVLLRQRGANLKHVAWLKRRRRVKIVLIPENVPEFVQKLIVCGRVKILGTSLSALSPFWVWTLLKLASFTLTRDFLYFHLP